MRIKSNQTTRWVASLFNAIIIGVLLISAIGSSYASTNIIIYNKKSTYQKKFYQHLKNKVTTSSINLITLDSSELSEQRIKEHAPSLVISLDKKSPKQLIGLKLKVPVLHALLTQSDSKQYLLCQSSCEFKRRKNHFFVLDQPLERQLALINLIKPNTKNIGVIYSEQTANLIKPLEQTASQFSLNIKPFLTTSDSLGISINDMTSSSDVLLALADTNIYNPTTLPQILLNSYRYRIPVIGFSKGFIKAGAIAGVVSNLSQLAAQMSEILLDFEAGEAILSNGTIYPKYFSVISNRRVANSLNLHFPSDHNLTATLKSREIP